MWKFVSFGQLFDAGVIGVVLFQSLLVFLVISWFMENVTGEI